MRNHDTSSAALDRQAALQASLLPEERILRSFAVSSFAREFARAALRSRNPSLTDDEVNSQLVWELYRVKKRER